MPNRSTDAYLDSSGLYLRNLVGAESEQELAEIETDVVAIRDLQLVIEPVPGRFDLGHLQRVHEHLFGDVYDWAGQIRTVNIDKGIPFAKGRLHR